MAENSYAQLIDDFEKGINVLKGETLTEYIKRMGGVDYNGGRLVLRFYLVQREISLEWNPGVESL
jgi:hypothetical protein